MKRLLDDSEEITRLLDLNLLINDYIGKKRPAPEECKSKLPLNKPLLVFDLNIEGATQPGTSTTLQPKTSQAIQSRRGTTLPTGKIRSHTTLSSIDQKSKRSTQQTSIDKPFIEKPVTKYERVQSAKLPVNKIMPPKKVLDTGLQRHHFSSLDARCKKHMMSKTMLKNRYEIENIIGRGHFATVNKAKDVLTNKHVAIKTLNQESDEPKLFKYLQHPNIIKNLNTFTIDGKIYLVLEYFPLTLSNYLKNNSLKNNEERLKPLFKQLCKAIQHLHMQGIVHRDIKLQNILVEEIKDEQTKEIRPSIKLIDFGLAVKMDSKNPKMTCFKDFCGTPNYVAPQVISGQEYEGKAADCWAIGVVLYLMLVGRFPFKAKEQSELYKKIKKGKLCFPTDISPKGLNLITNILKVEPAQRLNIYGILNDPWLD